MNKRIPRVYHTIFRICCPADRRDDLEGDFTELYRKKAGSEGRLKTVLTFLADCLSLIPLKLLTYRKSKTQNLMLRNYLKVASRNLIKDKSYAFINISGLAVGIACAFIILIYVRLELSFDGFHAKGGQIYRLQHVYSVVGAPIGPAMVQEYPEVITATRIYVWATDKKITVDENKIFYEDLYYVDNNFFETFSFEFISGDPKTALTGPTSLVMTESAARRYFGNENPVGKTVSVENLNHLPSSPLTVTAVINDVPYNSHLQFDYLVPFEILEKNPNVDIIDSWINDWIATYVVLRKGADPTPIEEDYPRFFEQHTGTEFTDPLRLMPLADIRHHSNYLRADFIEQGNINHIRIFSAVALLVLLIACINYMNLSTAKSIQRAKEVGLRKVMGAGSKQLISQFLIESILISLLALLLASALVWLSRPSLFLVLGIDLTPGLTDIFDLCLTMAAITLSTGLVAGSYPAFYLSSYTPASVLRESKSSGRKSSRARKGLVVIQLSVSVTLIIGALVVLDQMNFVQQKDLGFRADQIMTTNFGRRPAVNEKWDLLKSQLMSIPGIKEVASTSSVPGDNAPYWGYKFEGDDENENGEGWPGYYVGPQTIDILDIEVIMGRSFSEEYQEDQNAFMLNQSGWEDAISRYGDAWKEPIGKTIEYHIMRDGEMQMVKKGKVIGILKDFHFRSLQSPLEPLVIQQSDNNSHLLIKVEAGQISSIIEKIEDLWPAWNSSKPFNYEFLDQQYADYYESEARFSRQLIVFCGLAILIACMGLFGLASFTAQQRIKEIGVRKVLGASVVNILALISSDFFKLVGISLLVAFPVAWFLVDSWLQNFAYRIDISWVSFALAALATVVLSLITISSQSFRAANSNPVDSLRNE